MNDTNSTNGEKRNVLRTIIIATLFALVIGETILSYTFPGMILSLPFPIILIIGGIFTTLWMIYLYIEENAPLLRYTISAFIILLIIAGILLPFSSLPQHTSIYLAVYGSSIFLLYYYLHKKLSMKYDRSTSM